MYAVVGCSECGGYWLLEDPDDQESATCPTCGRAHRTDRLKRFHAADDRAAAAEARARLLADKRNEADAFAAVDDVTTLEREVDDGETGVSEREYLERSGVDPDAVAAAGDTSVDGSRSRDEVVRDALREGHATESAVVEYATAHGVPADAARDLLEKLVRRGEVSESRGEYRLL
jgi:hypothetical protein